MATLPREIYIKQRKRRRDDEGEEAPAYLRTFPPSLPSLPLLPLTSHLQKSTMTTQSPSAA
jgi:hypothetical protein